MKAKSNRNNDNPAWSKGRARSYIVLLRPHHYLKNVFIFAPLFFAGKITYLDLLYRSFSAFLAFSLAASSVYIFNDYRDIEEDKEHPLKQSRPLASGQVSIRSALSLMVLLCMGSLSLAAMLNFHLLLLLCLYMAMNIAYSMRLKHISLVDVFLIAFGFLLRIYAGAAVTNIDLSIWIILMTFLLALFLALAKRRDDIFLASEHRKVRKNIDGYNLELVNSAMTIMASVIMVSYVMYTLSSEIISKFHTSYLYITSVFVLFGILRYMQISFVEKNAGNPTMALMKDRLLQLAILGWVLSFIVLIYL